MTGIMARDPGPTGAMARWRRASAPIARPSGSGATIVAPIIDPTTVPRRLLHNL
jgi:hypothetical protein